MRARAAEFVLKLDLAEDIIEVLGLAEQTREVPDLSVPLIPGDEPPTPEEARATALAALWCDARDPRGWQVLAWSALVKGDLATYARYMRAVACLLEGDADAWATAVATNLGVPDDGLVAEMLVTGERLTGGELLPALAAFAQEFVPADEPEVLLAEIEALSRSIPRDDSHGFAVRILGEGGSVEELTVASAEDNEG